MAAQQSSTPPKTKRWGIFPHPFRLFVIIFVLIFAVIAGIIGIRQAWGNVSNIIAAILGAVSVILGILTFWPSTSSNEASALVSSIIPQPNLPFQINNYNYINQGQQLPAQNFHSPMIDNANNFTQDNPDPPPENRADNSQKTSSNIPGVQPPVTTASVPSQSGASAIDTTYRGPLIKLTGQECDALTYDLLAAYPVREDFEIMLRVKLNRRLNTLVDTASNYRNLIFKLIEVTEAEGWTTELVMAAYEQRPRNPELQKWHLKYAVTKETSEVTNTPTANNIGPELHRLTQLPPGIPEISRDNQTMASDEKQRNQKSTQILISDHPLARACESMKEVNLAVQQSKVIFEGRGDIQQIHYLQAIGTLHQVASHIHNLYVLVQTVAPLPVHLDRERLIMDLRHMSTEIRESIEHIEHYDTLNAHLRERNRKDTEIRLSTILSHLINLSSYILKGPL